jgi:hypothetical protein
MKPNQRTVCRDPWSWAMSSVSTESGYRLEPFRAIFREQFEARGLIWHDKCGVKFMLGTLHGQKVEQTEAGRDEARRLGILYGYSQPFGRNSIQFVQSRAARRRGYVCKQARYLRQRQMFGDDRGPSPRRSGSRAQPSRPFH